jgi:hypothetical protein
MLGIAEIDDLRRNRVMRALSDDRTKDRAVKVDMRRAEMQIVPRDGPRARLKASCTVFFARLAE